MMPFLALTLILLLALSGRIAYLESKEREKAAAFIETERRASTTVIGEKKMRDIEFVEPSMDFIIPNDRYTSTTLAIQDELRPFFRLKMANFSGATNTQLKLEYGAQNLDKLTEYEENFVQFETILDRYIKALISEEKYQTAMEIAEYIIDAKATISGIYMSLCDCYIHLNDASALNQLIKYVKSSSLIMKDSILDYINSSINPMAEPDEPAAPVDFSEGSITIKE